MRKILFNAAILAAFFFISNGKSFCQINNSSVTATISVTGDLMCHAVQFNYARVSKDSFDFKPAFSKIKQFLRNSDFTFGNLETVTAGESQTYSGYPFFNTPDEYIFALKEAGFDLLTTANNHSLDQGEKGLLRTIKIIKKNNLKYNGTFTSKRDKDSIRIFNINGIKITFLAYTFGTNGIPIPKNKPYIINLIDENLIGSDIKKARNQGAEIVLVHLHYGTEYKREPTDEQRKIVNNITKYGADIVIGGHPHVLEPVDYFKTNNAKLDTGFVAYSMGNFFSNQRWRYSDCGMILNISITKNIKSDSIYISNVTYTPTWVFKGKIENKDEFVILPSNKNLSDSSTNFLTQEDAIKMKQSFENTKKTLTKYTSRIKVFRYTEDLINQIKKLALPFQIENPPQKLILTELKNN